jgi:serine/threonine protein kinase
MTGSDFADDTGERLGRALGPQYAIRRLIGRGGFAGVYEAWDGELERRLAVKVLRPDIAWTAGMLQRFKQETRAIARLDHPHILPIHFVGEGEGLTYYVMPYVEGQSLGDVLRTRGALAPERTVAIAVPILEALQHAHERGLVHRDIKPDNIMLDVASGRPMLVDFGIAKRLDAAGGLTQTGFVVGTPHYMSPEQALGQGDLDARSDIYSFGAVLYQMVTGTPPFEGESSQEIVGKHIAEPPPIASEVNTAIPGWISRVIGRCLAKKATGRGDETEVVAAAGVRSHGIDTDARTELVESNERPSAAAHRKPGRPRPRRRWVAIAVSAALVIVFGLLWNRRPRLVFDNPLVVPVEVSIGEERWSVEPGDRVRVGLPGGRPAALLWTAHPPIGTGDRAQGVEFSGALTIDDPRGRLRGHATASPGDRAYFAPLITNNTGRALTFTVNTGTAEQLACNCSVPAGATRMPIGYYPLFANSSVRAEDAAGRSASFQDLGAEVDRRTGLVSLRFGSDDLR